MLLHATIRKMAPGECMTLIATDPSTLRDVSNFCRFLDHTLVAKWQHEGRYVYQIRKFEKS